MTDDTGDTAKAAKAPADDPIATVILATLHAAGPGASISVMDAARAVAENRRRRDDPGQLWRRYMTAVRQQALHLARQGRIEIIRKGVPVDLENFKGVVRLRLPQPD